MATRAVDVVARLQLRAEQFSSETGRAFAGMETRARSSAQQVKDSFASSFAEVNRLAQTALVMPRTASGSLDLSSEITNLRAAALAAENNATALREMSVAQTAAASSGRVNAEATKLEADAAAVAALNYENEAAKLRERAAALELVQTELGRTTSATVAHGNAAKGATGSANAMRYALLGVSYSAQDTITQLSMGANALQVITIQAMQAAGGFAAVGGKAEKVASILLGPWGIAASAALLALSSFIPKLAAANDNLAEHIAKLRESAETTALAERAKAAFAATEAGAIADVNAMTKEIEAQNEALKTNAERLNIRAKNRLENLTLTRGEITDQLADARRVAGLARADQRLGASSAQDAKAQDEAIKRADAAVGALEARLRTIDKAIGDGNAVLLRSRAELADEAAKRAIDPLATIKRNYEGPDGLIEKTKQRAIAEGWVDERLTAQLKTIRKQQEAEEARAKAAEAAAKKARKPTDSDLTQFVSPVGGGTLTGRYGEKRPGHMHGGIDLAVPVGTAVGAAAAGTVIEAGTLPGYGNVVIIDHGRGTTTRYAHLSKMLVSKGQVVAAGDQIALSGGAPGAAGAGNSQGPHLHYEVRRGNKPVDPRTGLYPTDEASLLKGQRDRAAAEKELEALVVSLTRRFDEAGEAGREFERSIADINKALSSGAITEDQARDLRDSAFMGWNRAEEQARAEAARRSIVVADAPTEIGGLTDAVGKTLEDGIKGLAQGAIDAGEELRYAAGSVADIFDLRLSGPLRTLLQPGGIEKQAYYAAKSTVDGLRGLGLKIDESSVAQLANAISAATLGQVGGSVFASITGGRQNPLASSLGGVLGDVAGKAIGKSVGEGASGLLKTLGGAAGPIGAVLGGVLGNVVGGLFRSAPKGSSGITVDQFGKLMATAASGNDKGATSAASSMAGSVAQGIQQIADQLGAKITGATDVRIGTYDGKWRVNDHGGAIGGVKGSGAISFDTQEQAIAYAIGDALKDGVLSGISQAALNILRSGQDLAAALSKAMAIEAIPKDLKAMLDPVGAAVDELNRKWEKTVAALNEGGASAEQMAQAQQLYNLQLEKVKTDTPAAAQELKDFLRELRGGSNSPYSLRTQEKMARDALQPFLDRINAGETVDQAKYIDAANKALDVGRQLYGSTSEFFALFDSVQAATNKAISAIDNATPISAAVPDPFTKATADAAALTAQNTQTGNEMTETTNDLLQRLVEAVERLASGGSTTDEFIGEARGYIARVA